MLRCGAAALSSRPSSPACWTLRHRPAAAAAEALCLAQGQGLPAVMVAALLSAAARQAREHRFVSAEQQQHMGIADGIAEMEGGGRGCVLSSVRLGGVSAFQCRATLMLFAVRPGTGWTDRRLGMVGSQLWGPRGVRKLFPPPCNACLQLAIPCRPCSMPCHSRNYGGRSLAWRSIHARNPGHQHLRSL